MPDRDAIVAVRTDSEHILAGKGPVRGKPDVTRQDGACRGPQGCGFCRSGVHELAPDLPLTSQPLRVKS